MLLGKNYKLTDYIIWHNCNRPNAQDDIETLADRTNGKPYSVPDKTGPDAINDPLSGDINNTKHDSLNIACRILIISALCTYGRNGAASLPAVVSKCETIHRKLHN